FASLRPSASAEPRGSGLFVSGVGDKSLPVPGHRCCCAFVSRRATRVPFRTRLGSMVRVLPLCSCVRGLSLACLLVVGLCGGCGRLAGCWVGGWWWGGAGRCSGVCVGSRGWGGGGCFWRQGVRVWGVGLGWGRGFGVVVGVFGLVGWWWGRGALWGVVGSCSACSACVASSTSSAGSLFSLPRFYAVDVASFSGGACSTGNTC